MFGFVYPNPIPMLILLCSRHFYDKPVVILNVESIKKIVWSVESKWENNFWEGGIDNMSEEAIVLLFHA